VFVSCEGLLSFVVLFSDENGANWTGPDSGGAGVCERDPERLGLKSCPTFAFAFFRPFIILVLACECRDGEDGEDG